jgi:hypothetical protein
MFIESEVEGNKMEVKILMRCKVTCNHLPQAVRCEVWQRECRSDRAEQGAESKLRHLVRMII